jgi:hypothetical protein
MPEQDLMDMQIALDRRKPRRVETDNRHLIAPLREPTSVSPPLVDRAAEKLLPTVCGEVEDSDPLAPARGIAAGLLIGAAIWSLIGAVAWSLL